MLAEITKELDHNGHAQRLMQSISYSKQYDLDTGEMSYREIRQSIVRLHGALAIEDSRVHFNNRGYCRDCRHRKVLCSIN